MPHEFERSMRADGEPHEDDDQWRNISGASSEKGSSLIAAQNLTRNPTYRPIHISLCFRSGRRPCRDIGFNLPDATDSSSHLALNPWLKLIAPNAQTIKPENVHHSQAFLSTGGVVSSIVLECVGHWTSIICSISRTLFSSSGETSSGRSCRQPEMIGCRSDLV